MQTKHIYQRYLKEEFERRRKRSNAYSLRAFARDLSLPSPKLSQYLSGNCGISKAKALQIAKKLNLGAVESDLFACSAEAAHARDPISREAAAVRLEALLKGTFSEINMEKFSLIQDWHHFAILELTDISSFKGTVAWVAAALDIPTEEVKTAVERLERLGFLKREGEKWTQLEADLETPPEFSSRAVREYHRQMMGLVSGRMESIPLNKRELGSVLFGISHELIPEMKELVRKFQRDAAVLASRSEDKEALYILNCQLMPLFQGELNQ